MVVSARGQTDLLTRAIGGGQITTEWTSVRGICRINRPQAPISEVNAEPIRHQRQLGYTLDRGSI